MLCFISFRSKRFKTLKHSNQLALDNYIPGEELAVRLSLKVLIFPSFFCPSFFLSCRRFTSHPRVAFSFQCDEAYWLRREVQLSSLTLLYVVISVLRFSILWLCVSGCFQPHSIVKRRKCLTCGPVRQRFPGFLFPQGACYSLECSHHPGCTRHPDNNWMVVAFTCGFASVSKIKRSPDSHGSRNPSSLNYRRQIHFGFLGKRLNSSPNRTLSVHESNTSGAALFTDRDGADLLHIRSFSRVTSPLVQHPQDPTLLCELWQHVELHRALCNFTADEINPRRWKCSEAALEGLLTEFSPSVRPSYSSHRGD